MKWKTDGCKEPDCDIAVFESTGKELFIRYRAPGLSPDRTRLFGGFSHGYSQEGGFARSELFEGYLTPEERREIADYMIGLWTRFGDGHNP